MPRSHHWLALTVTLLVIALIGACVDEPSAPELEEWTAGEPFFSVPGGAAKNWDAGSFINVEVTGNPSSSVLSAISAAADEWNTYVFDLPGYYDSLPHVSESPSTSTQNTPKIRIDYSETGTWGWCGSSEGWDGEDIWVLKITKKFENEPCGGRIVQDLEGVVAHEMSHAFGFGHQSSENTYWCVCNVPETGNLNHHPCTLEQQWVYEAYGLRTTRVHNDSLIVQTLEISPVIDTVEVGDTIRYSLLAIAGPEPSDPSGSTDTVTADIGWTLGNTSVISNYDDDYEWIIVQGVASGTSDLIATGNNTTAMAWPWPADTVSVVVTSDACFREEDTTAWRYSDQFLSAGCSETGSNMRYKWKFKDSGSWTAYSADTLYDFEGHPYQGNPTVRMRIKNISTGDSATATKNFIVQSSTVTLSGPTYVTDKTLKTYTSNTTGDWYERWNPDTNYNWGYSTLTDEDTYTRIWPAGWYDVALRNDSTTSGGLHRRRLDVEVCWQCSPEVEVSVVAPNFWASIQATALADYWGLFGAGPWLSTGAGEPAGIVRYYDLTGLHEPGSPFASIAWLGEDGGTTEDTAGRWAVSWSVDDTAGEGVKITTFRVTPTNKAASYRFGFAVDPDVGDPTDDRSGYDSARGLVYVTGGSDQRVIGLLLREKNTNALQTVRQFGVRNVAPRTVADARQIQESPGVYLTSETEDVQFVLSTAEVAGAHTWQVVMLGAASVSELQALADEVSKSD